MQKEEIAALFDKQAASYDQQWRRLAPMNDALHWLTSIVLAELPPQAHILCVGAGTGAEILYLAQKFPEWHFTAAEPSTAMLAVCRRQAEEQGIASRCVFHAGYLDSLPSTGSFDAATAFLVSQFILERQVRAQFFQSIADRLGPAGIFVSSDLAGDLAVPEGQARLDLWFRVMSGSSTSPEGVERMPQPTGTMWLFCHPRMSVTLSRYPSIPNPHHDAVGNQGRSSCHQTFILPWEAPFSATSPLNPSN